MKLKRLFSSLILCVCILTMALPASAASSFSDIHDSSTAVNADVLRLMGVVSGSGSNQFSPPSNLTRAEFCVMAVNIMGRGDQVPIHTTRTIFRDVTARHWARGYVNLAASITVGGGNEDQAGSRLISGTGTGHFNPDSPITYAQAVTILMRILGYTDQQTGAVWPAGYLNLAHSLALTRGVSAGANTPITRAQAAQLFVNLLSAKTASGQTYCSTLGSATENVMLLAVGVTGDDGIPGAIRTSKGTYHPVNQGVVPTALPGCRGTLVVNDRNELITFVPDGSTSVTLTLSGDAQATYLKSTDGTRYVISSSTPAFSSNTDTDDSTYGEIWMDLHSGSQVTLFLEGGKVIGLYYSAVGQTSHQAMVVTGQLNRASFHQLTGGVEDYTIKKNNQPIHLDDIHPYDVVTYDAVSNTLVVSDLRLTCVYESAYPNPTTPTTIEVLGHKFNVLESATESVSQFQVGKSVTLLLTADGQIAGMTQPTAKIRSTAIGLAGTNSAEMFLPSGGSITLKSSQDLSDQAKGQLVGLSSSKAGVLKGTTLNTQTTTKDFDLVDMTLGNYTVAAGVRVFERTNRSTLVPVSLSDLDMRSIPSEQIVNYHLNTSNLVDLIILEDTTGDAYQYGQYIVKSTWENRYDDNGNPVLDQNNKPVQVERRELSFQNSEGTIPLPHVGFIGKSGTYVGIALDQDNKLRGRVDLTAVEQVSRSDFFTSQGSDYVNVKGMVYPVADDVQAFNNDNKTWFTGEDVLSAVRAYSNDLTLYVDPVGGKVRIIAAN